MILTLEVVGDQGRELGADGRKVFNAIGGTIGRLPDNDWVFPDPYVSGRHALIRYLNGKYFIEDTSTNGVFINAPDNRVSPSQAQQLRDGDRLYIDAYEIRVSIASDPAAAARNDPLGALKARPSKPSPASRSAPAATAEDDQTVSLALRGVQRSEQDESGEHGTEWFGMSEVSDPKRSGPPARQHAKVQAPRPLAARRTPARYSSPAPARAVASEPSRRARPAATQEGAGLQALLEAAGIEGLQPSDETARTLGEVLRTAIGGLMEVLRARERMKDDLRLRGTTFKAAHNNPLKFSANVEDAFHNLLVKHNPAYLDPAEAVEDACRDVRDHQAALLDALRLAFEAMLARFDPNRLQEEFDRQLKKGSILGVPAKLRYWDLYRDKYVEAVKDGAAAFRNLFADELAKAYEEQLERLRAMSRREK